MQALKRKSLRFWVAVGMALAVAPLLASAVGGYALIHRGVIADFADVAQRQRQEVAPLLRLRLQIWETLPAIDEYMIRFNDSSAQVYQDRRGQIERAFASLQDQFRQDRPSLELLARAHGDWIKADHLAIALLSEEAGDAHTAPSQLRLFHNEVAAVNGELTAIFDRLNTELEADHDAALIAYERSVWIAAIAALLSLISIGVGVYLVGRILTSSVDRLVKGAALFAEGDRSHRIDIAVPPELQRVAHEFNHMIERIQHSEQTLSQIAHQDSLTGLGNRRAFEDAFTEAVARRERFGESLAVLAVDIDHFKRVNDQHGHAVGDRALSHVAKVMGANVRPFDKVFRTGGEEFIVLLPNASRSAAFEVAERLRAAVSATPLSLEPQRLTLSVSIGAAVMQSTDSQAQLLNRADEALYDAKSKGRNRVVEAA